ncbi:unnamed protein product [Phytomonas sp. Hart1]|nr:unnamed protein product [Phytomonas sp. Hart1]|eukprot:CCW69347.1 unnamed protein product [Phytomonas sp. isolate Hart1]
MLLRTLALRRPVVLHVGDGTGASRQLQALHLVEDATVPRSEQRGADKQREQDSGRGQRGHPQAGERKGHSVACGGGGRGQYVWLWCGVCGW